MKNPFRCKKRHEVFIPVDKPVYFPVAKDDLDKMLGEQIKEDPYFAAVYKAAKDSYDRNEGWNALTEAAEDAEKATVIGDEGLLPQWAPYVARWLRNRADSLYGMSPSMPDEG